MPFQRLSTHTERTYTMQTYVSSGRHRCRYAYAAQVLGLKSACPHNAGVHVRSQFDRRQSIVLHKPKSPAWPFAVHFAFL
jgi:hypothetical protein